MGGGGILGGGGSSEQTTRKTTNITTKTTTDIRDIGITGKDAVAFEKLQTSSLNNMVQQIGESYNALVGGAGKLTQTASRQAKKTREAAVKQSRTQLNQATQQANSLIKQASDTGPDMGQVLPWLAVIATIITFVGSR
jgi:ElaB/YqjD/DUF883 family membrane-anchored ribosome-binding protein